MPEGREDVQGLSETQGGESEGLEQEASETETQTDELTGDESIRDLVERAYQEEQAKLAQGDGDNAEKDGQAPKETPGTESEGQKPQKQDSQEQVESWQFQPPGRLSAAEKETFNKLPRKLKPAVARMFAEHERAFTQGQTQMSRAYAEAKHAIDAVRPYYVTHPELAEAGYTEAGFLASLVAAHAALSDPKTKRNAYIKLGRDLGLESEINVSEESPQNQANFDIQQHPQFLALQETVNQLRGVYQQNQQTQFQGSVESVKAEFQAAIEEKDQFGRYRYPELHEESFWTKAKPLVNGLLETDPSLSYGNAVKRAALVLRQGYFEQPSQTGLPTNNTQQRALSAAVSVRGRSAPQASSMNMPEKLPDATRDLAQLAYDNILSGRGG